MSRVRGRWRRLGVGIVLSVVWLPALSGEVLVYRHGIYCPRDRAADAPRMTEREAMERALALMPREFCAPSFFVSGCDAEPEQAFDTWRIYVRQYKLSGAERRYGGLDHSYVVLDTIGNCLANIPGT